MKQYVWQIQIKSDLQAENLLEDRKRLFTAKVAYTKKKGNKKWTSIVSTAPMDKTYAGKAPNIATAISRALECAKRDKMEQPEVIGVWRLGPSEF